MFSAFYNGEIKVKSGCEPSLCFFHSFFEVLLLNVKIILVNIFYVVVMFFFFNFVCPFVLCVLLFCSVFVFSFRLYSMIGMICCQR